MICPARWKRVAERRIKRQRTQSKSKTGALMSAYSKKITTTSCPKRLSSILKPLHLYQSCSKIQRIPQKSAPESKHNLAESLSQFFYNSYSSIESKEALPRAASEWFSYYTVQTIASRVSTAIFVLQALWCVCSRFQSST